MILKLEGYVLCTKRATIFSVGFCRVDQWLESQVRTTWLSYMLYAGCSAGVSRLSFAIFTTEEHHVECILAKVAVS